MKRRVGIGLGALVVIISLLLAGNEARNAAARAELEEACACAHRSVESTLLDSGPIFAQLFQEDEEMMRDVLRGEVTGLCDQVRAALEPLEWNMGRTFAPRVEMANANRIRAALERARPRCPAIYGELFGGDEASEARAAELCDELFDGMRVARQAGERASAWAWPAAIRSSMCLDGSNDPRAEADERP